MKTKLFKTIQFATRCLLQHKLRSALSILGVVCGVMAVLTMISIGEGAKKELLKQIGQLGTNNIYIKTMPLTKEQAVMAREHKSRGLCLKDKEQIMHGCKYVDMVASIKELTVTTAANTNVSPQVVACSSSYLKIQGLNLSQGRFIADQDIEQRNSVCVLGSAVAEKIGLRGKIGHYIRIEKTLFLVVGILDRLKGKADKNSVVATRNFNEMIFVPQNAVILSNSEKKTATNEDTLTELIVHIKEREQVSASGVMISRIMDLAHNRVRDYQTIIPLELLYQAQKTQQTFNIVLGIIAAVSLFVGGIGIMNVMLATISERTREIGIRRSLGATCRNIMVQFLVESVILTFSGGVIGIIGGVLSSLLVSYFAGWTVAVTVWAILAPAAMSVVVGLFFGLYPAVMASKMDPIAALRYE